MLIKESLDQYTGGKMKITRYNKSVAKLTALQPVKRHRYLGSAKGMLTDDFNMPLKDFDEYQ